MSIVISTIFYTPNNHMQMNNTLTISFLQSNIHWEDKAANLAMFTSKIKAIEEQTEIIILPEMFNTGFSMNPSILAENMDGETVTWMKQMAAEKRSIVTGSLIIREQDKFYNRLIWMQPNGVYGYYDKRHLFSYAGEDKEFTPGNKRLIAQLKGWKINTQICYDLRFPIWSRQANENEYDILLFVASWPMKRIEAWKALLTARAIENQCYVIGLNRTGIDGNGFDYSGDSMLIDPMGVAIFSNHHEEITHTFQIDKKQVQEVRERLPFLKDKE